MLPNTLGGLAQPAQATTAQNLTKQSSQAGHPEQINHHEPAQPAEAFTCAFPCTVHARLMHGGTFALGEQSSLRAQTAHKLRIKEWQGNANLKGSAGWAGPSGAVGNVLWSNGLSRPCWPDHFGNVCALMA